MLHGLKIYLRPTSIYPNANVSEQVHEPGTRLWLFSNRLLTHNQGGFFIQSVPIKLALPQAAQLSLFFYRKISSVAPP